MNSHPIVNEYYTAIESMQFRIIPFFSHVSTLATRTLFKFHRYFGCNSLFKNTPIIGFKIKSINLLYISSTFGILFSINLPVFTNQMSICSCKQFSTYRLLKSLIQSTLIIRQMALAGRSVAETSKKLFYPSYFNF